MGPPSTLRGPPCPSPALARIICDVGVGSRRDWASHGFSATDGNTLRICLGGESRVKSRELAPAPNPAPTRKPSTGSGQPSAVVRDRQPPLGRSGTQPHVLSDMSCPLGHVPADLKLSFASPAPVSRMGRHGNTRRLSASQSGRPACRARSRTPSPHLPRLIQPRARRHRQRVRYPQAACDGSRRRPG